jgi:F0F1-type ATP synthase gamma subunit
MIEANQKKPKSAPTWAAAPEKLPYRVELMKSGERLVERILGRAANAQLANAIFKAALAEHPDRHIALRRGTRVIAESGG